MKKALFFPFQVSLCTVGYLCTSNGIANAQVTSDGTVNTQVNQNGSVAEITGGETRGSNLFHSFSDFSIPTGNEAFFNNADSISNIFSRVTGGNISNINGAIRANGSASLFLINPAGIIFGENARLDIGGSFYGSTASSVLFEDGEFSAVDNLQQPILTINAPIGLGFRDQPGDIINRSRAAEPNSAGDLVGLEVLPGNNLALIGGNIGFDGGVIRASAGTIEIAGIAEEGNIDFSIDNGNFNLDFPNNLERADVFLINNSVISATGEGGGSIQVTGDLLELSDNSAIVSNTIGSEIGQDILIDVDRFIARSGSGIGVNLNSQSDAERGGNLNIIAANSVEIDGENSSLSVATIGEGDSGNLSIETRQLTLQNNGTLSVDTLGSGNGGNINIQVEQLDVQNNAEINANTSGAGTGGNISIETQQLNVRDSGRIFANTTGTGTGGNLDINAQQFNVSNNARISASTTNVKNGGNAGSLTVSTDNLRIESGGKIVGITAGSGRAGTIDINATGNIELIGVSEVSGIGNESRGTGNANSLTINANSLTLNDGGQISTSAIGSGNAGDMTITANNIEIAGEAQTETANFPSALLANVFEGASGKGGTIIINSQSLSIRDSGEISASTSGTGNAGGVTLNSQNLSILDGGQISANTFDAGTGGNLDIETGQFNISNNGRVSASTAGTNNGGNAGSLTVNANNLHIETGGQILGITQGSGTAGTVDIDVAGNIELIGISENGLPSAISTESQEIATGNANSLTIDTDSLILVDGGQISTSTEGAGNGADMTITANNIEIVGEAQTETRNFPSALQANVRENASSTGGTIFINSQSLSIRDRGEIAASTSGTGNAGGVEITASDVEIIGESSSISSSVNLSGSGNAGSVTLNSQNLSILNGGEISVSALNSGEIGTLNISTEELLLENGRIIAFDLGTTQTERSDEVNNINLQIDGNLLLRKDSQISAQAINNATGGNIGITADFVIAFPDGNNDIVANAGQGQGGNIVIDAESVFGIEEQPLSPETNDINASSEVEILDGSVTINTLNVNPVQGVTELPTNVVVPEETTQQACEANRESAAQNGLSITGKGGIIPAPELPLNSLNLIGGKINSTSFIPQPVETSQGKIQPARGVEVTESGEVILTAYRTNNSGERLPKIEQNCDRT